MFYAKESGSVLLDQISASPTERWLDHLNGIAAVKYDDQGRVTYYLRTSNGLDGDGIYKSVKLFMTDSLEDRACRFIDQGWSYKDLESLIEKLGDKFEDHELPSAFANWYQIVS